MRLMTCSLMKFIIADSIARLHSMTILQREVEAEMRRLKLELKQTMDMYNSACKEAIDAKEKVKQSLLFFLQSKSKHTLERRHQGDAAHVQE